MESTSSPTSPLVTPIHVKTDGASWPGDPMFYLIAGNGLFRCRNHEFFVSCAPAPCFPNELADQHAFLRLRIPKVPRGVFETVVGFLGRIYDLYRSEAIALLAWDRISRQYRIIVPPQEAFVSRGRNGDIYALSVRYQVAPVPSHQVVLLSVHSHASGAAYASGTDKWDETYRTGIHVVVGRIYRDPPDLHIEAVADGSRFRVRPEMVFEGYEQRRHHVPAGWIRQVRVTVDDPYKYPKGGTGSCAGHDDRSDDSFGRQDRSDDDDHAPRGGRDSSAETPDEPS